MKHTDDFLRHDKTGILRLLLDINKEEKDGLDVEAGL